MRLGDKALESKETDKALRYFKKAVRKSPNSVEPWVGYGRAAFADGDHDLAFEAFEKAISIDPEGFEPRYQRALAAEDTDDYALALADWNHLVSKHPTQPKSYVGRGWHAYRICGSPLEAERDGLEALKCDPSNTDANTMLAHLYYDGAQFETTLKHLRHVELAEPTSRWAKVAIGQCLFSLRRYAEAATVLAEVLHAEDEDTGGHIEYARSLLYCEAFELARTQIEYLVEKLPISGGPTTLNAIILMGQGDLEGGTVVLREGEKQFQDLCTEDDNRFNWPTHQYNIGWFLATRALLTEKFGLEGNNPSEDREAAIESILSSFSASFDSFRSAKSSPELDFVWSDSRIIEAIRPVDEQLKQLLVHD